MKLYNRILSTLLAVITMLGALTGLSVVNVSAAGELNADEEIENIYVETVYTTPEEKLATMKPVEHLNNAHTQLYIDSVSGEVAAVDKVTGQILFSNPYDVASSKGSASTKKQILSQLVVQYVDNGTTKYLYSFEEAAMREQITVLNIKNGVRVEYTIGREESRKLVPRWITRESYETYILGPLKEAADAGEIQTFFYEKFTTYYTLQALSEKKSKKAKEQLLLTYPICEETDIYTFAADASSVEINWVEGYIKGYCEDYSFEQMDADHEKTGYEATDEQYPVFKMALEYSLDENGALNVRLPCNGLRYDMAVYTLEYITVLPYMGAGNSINPGYNFYPDGSGSLFDFEQLNTKSTTTVRGKVYGVDYAYHQISGTYQKTIRYPVYGTVASEAINSFTFSTQYKLDENGDLVLNSNKEPTDLGTPTSYTIEYSSTVYDEEDIQKYVEARKGTLLSIDEVDPCKRGYVAFIESGESLAEIATYHAGNLSDYNTMMNYFNPKPKDSYDISDSISVTSSSTWTVVSDRKYTGSIKIRYQMLTDETLGKEAQEAEKAEGRTYAYYDATWLGMAEAYRDYLVSNGTLSKLTEEETEEDIPLYLEVFGALETQQQIMTVPVDVMTPLTTFENVLEMYNKLSGSGVSNINFKLTGFANGGMYATVPSSLKWESAVGGSKGFEELIAEANKINESEDKHLGLFPDFDFAYVQVNTLFDSTNLKKDAVKTIDNRYSSKRQYSATQQSYVSFFQLAISPSRYSKFYEKLMKNYEKYGLNSMSIASLGTALNSDFDEDDPYNREDSKEFTVQAFEDLQSAGYSLMTEGANAYTWGYVDHIINVDLDSSRYIKSSASVPFIGAVLHGYIQFAGTPLNEEGDTDYAILRAIENGAGLYFILSYQNTNELKEDYVLSQYYSVRYDIWESDVISYYTELNNLLKDVQNKVIIDHRFLTGERVLDLDELKADLEQQLKDAAEAEEQKQHQIMTDKILEVANAWKTAENAAKQISDLVAEMEQLSTDITVAASNIDTLITVLPVFVDDALKAMEEAYDGALDYSEHKDTLTKISNLGSQITSMKTNAINVLKNYASMESKYAEIQQLIEDVEAAKTIIANSDTLTDEVKNNLIAKIDDAETGYLKAAKDAAVCSDGSSLQTLLDKHVSLVTQGSVTSVAKIAADGIANNVKGTDNFAYLNADLLNLCADYLFEESDIYDAVKVEDTENNTGDVEEDVTNENKYFVDTNQIVVVTYGDRDETTHEKTAYKSFILNYNNFAVRVEYNGVKYTIPSGGYVVLYHE